MVKKKMTVTDIKHLIKRANFRLEDEDFTAARADYEVILAQDDKISEALVGLGDCCFGLGEYEASEDAYRRLLLETPSDPDALFGLAAVLRVTECYEEAISLYERGFDEEPERTEAFWELAYSREMSGDKDGAKRAYKSCLAHHPDHGMAAHLLAAMTGTKTERAPADYIRDLFDDYAESFETSLVQKLEYRTPRIIADLIIKASDQSSLGSVIDLGCGTGLLGEQIEKHCENLEGIDISGKMLEKAQDKNIYRKLIKQDIIEYISNTDLAFDFFIAVDVFVYMGDLSEIFRLIKHRNRNEGKLVFSTEHFPGEGYFLEKTGRYSHSENYIKSLCLEFGYVITHFKIQDIRKDEGRNIRGGIYILEF